MALSRLFTYRGLGQAVSRALAPWRPTDLDLTRSGPAKCQKDELLAIIPDKPGVVRQYVRRLSSQIPNQMESCCTALLSGRSIPRILLSYTTRAMLHGQVEYPRRLFNRMFIKGQNL